MAEIIPSILTNDISDFRKKYSDYFALSHLFTKLHVDFVDGEFIRNKTLMPKDLKFLKTPFKLIAHFMMFDPGIYFDDAKQVGFDSVLVHYEAFDQDRDLESTLLRGKDLGFKVGVVINPETPLHMIGKYLKKVDLVQLMGIHPGFQGRVFMSSTIEKIKELRALSKSVIIYVDGGVKVGVARACVKAGADYLVVGSAILRSEDRGLAAEALLADIEI